MLERVLGRDRLRRPIGLHFAAIDAVRELGKTPPVTAEALFELGGVPIAASSPTVRMPSAASFPSMTLPTPWMRATGSGMEECFDFFGPDHEKPIGFAPVRGDLREKLVRRDAGRRGQRELLADRSADRFGNRGRGRQIRLRLGDIEIGLVERERLDEIGMAQQDLAHDAATPRDSA